MVQGWIDAQNILSERFYENASWMQKEIIFPIQNLRKELTDDVLLMKKLGKALLEELDKAEKDVRESWESYRMIGEELIKLTCQSRSNLYTITLNEKIKTHSDAWIVEMHYRMSITYLTTSWEKCSLEFSKMFSNMKKTECKRRH